MRAADELPPPAIDATSQWAISLHNVSRAASLPELRWLLLSGRQRHAVPAAVSDALATCGGCCCRVGSAMLCLPPSPTRWRRARAVHGDVMAGRSPLLVWMMRGCGAGVVCDGIG